MSPAPRPGDGGGASGDVASFLEAVYRVDLDTTAWCEGLWRGVEPLMPAGSVLVAGTYTWDGAAGRMQLGVMAASSATFVTTLRDLAPAANPDAVAATMGSSDRVYTLAPTLRSAKGAGDAMLGVMESLGAGDVLTLNAWLTRDGIRSGVCVSMSSAAPMALDDAQRTRWDRLAAHLDASHRLRTQMAATVEGVLSPDGRVLDATGPAREAPARAALSRAAASIDRARRREQRRDVGAVLEAWRAIHERRWTLVETTESDGRRLFLARVNVPDELPMAAATERERQVAALLQRGVAQKAIAFELEIAPSTVAFHVRNLARRLGVSTATELVARLSTGAWTSG